MGEEEGGALAQVILGHFFTKRVSVDPEDFCSLCLIVPSTPQDLVEKGFFDFRDNQTVKVLWIMRV